MSICPRCGMVFDVPQEDADLGSRPIIRSETTILDGENATVEIWFIIPVGHQTETTIRPTIRRRGIPTTRVSRCSSQPTTT